MKRSELRKNPEAYFWHFVQKADSDQCWLWARRARHNDGYGMLWWIDNKVWLAHRLAWTLTNGPIPKGMFVCHRCDNVRCVRPTHLFLGSCADNLMDMHAKGRGVNPPVVGARRLTAADVRDIRRRYANGETVGELERAFNYNHSNISKIIRRTVWKNA